MLTLGIGTIVVLLLIMGAVCAIGGYAFAQERQRRAGGGKTAQELKAELGDYKENVSEHFQTTANLLHEMTEQYRAVYEHMASGAQTLCDADRATSQIESLRAGLLPGVVAAVPAGEEADALSEVHAATDMEAALEALADELDAVSDPMEHGLSAQDGSEVQAANDDAELPERKQDPTVTSAAPNQERLLPEEEQAIRASVS